MKKGIYSIITILMFVNMFFANNLQAQSVNFTIANAQNTNDGVNDYYEADIQISTNSDFKLGSGLVYFNYNTAAFDINVFSNSNIEITYPSGYILGQSNGFPYYTSFVTNDNTDSRVAFSWQQGVSSGTYTGDNITSVATNLFHIKIQYLDVNEDAGFCFESGSSFDNQTYTACGPSTAGFADCTNYPGVQLTDDYFDCTEAVLPVELLYFTAEAYNAAALLTWETAAEINNSHFEVQHSINGVDFEVIGEVMGAGTTIENQYYEFIDQNPQSGLNYYRLRQVDYDENFEYTDIEVVSFDDQGNSVAESALQLTVYPNPTVQTLNVKTNQTGTDYIQVFNALGQMVLQQNISTTENNHRIDVGSLPSGSYYLKLADVNETVKFIKN